MIIEHLNQHQKEYIEDILEYHNNQLNYKEYIELKFNSIQTKNIELIIGQDEFTTLSLLTKKEDLKKYNCISIYEPFESILPIELYENFNAHLILEFSDIRRDFRKMYKDNKISLDTYDSLEKDEIKNAHLDILIDFILNNKDKKFIINCYAGISRSAAIGYILEDILNKDINEKEIEQNKILSHWRYSPNKMIIEKFTKLEFYNNYDEELDLDDIF